jgi:hypothetical protein
MATEEGKEACSMLPAAMATAALCFRGFLRGSVRRRAGGSERDEEARKRAWRPCSPLLSRCCLSGRVRAARLAAAVRGACAYLDAVYGAKACGDTTVRPRSTATDSRSLYARVPRRRHVGR